MAISPIKFRMFMNDPFLNREEQARAEEYKNDITNAYKNLDLKGFWQRKINDSRYFNKCELEYIRRYYPDIYEQAQETRRLYIENTEREKEQEEQKRKSEQKEKVKTTNDKFKRELKEMKYKIFIGEMVNIADFEFYKDDKYSNGKTTQNNMLYLAKQYAINIPLATQGFINNRLVSLNFKTGEIIYKTTEKNKKCSTKLGEYLEPILKKVQEEYKENLKGKIEKVKGAR